MKGLVNVLNSRLQKKTKGIFVGVCGQTPGNWKVAVDSWMVRNFKIVGSSDGKLNLIISSINSSVMNVRRTAFEGGMGSSREEKGWNGAAVGSR